MKSIDERTTKADAILAAYAVKHGSGFGRDHKEVESITRFRFQRDRGRIVHTEAFRRLKSKTQVFVGGGGDHYRTRLTHTLEVAGISRDLARALSLNEDLAECIALAHDLGHPPFGHAGETMLSEWMETFGKSFEHNIQSHRIVSFLEEHCSDYRGLNLNKEVLEGLLKHSTPHDHPGEVLVEHAPSLEAQVVNLADEITYTAHDSEDGLKAELFSLEEITAVPLVKDAYEKTKKRQTSLRGAIIDALVRDLYENIKSSSSYQCINTIDDVYALENPVIIFSDDMRNQLDILRKFLWENMYNHPFVLSHTESGQKIISKICRHLYDHPNDKMKEWSDQNECSLEDAIKDYVSGMTDSYAFYKADALGLLTPDVTDVLGSAS